LECKSDTPKPIVARIPRSWKPFIGKTTGYVYVLKKDSFSEAQMWQMKTHEPVLPTDVIQVEFRDFEKMGGIIEWKL